MRPHLRAPRLLISLQGYRRSWLRADLVAGLTVWAVLVPESLAYTTIAGVSPVVGLNAAVASLVLYALLGSSRHLVVGPMSATAALSAAVVAGFAVGLALTIIVRQLPKLLERDGIRFVARDVGQVRDVLAHTAGARPTYRTLDEAVTRRGRPADADMSAVLLR